MSVLRKITKAIDSAFGWLLRGILQILVLLAFRPKLIYASEEARKKAFAKPQVIICNHIRGMDAAMLYVLLRKRKFVALFAKDLWDSNTLLRLFMRYMPVITVDRQHATLSWLRDSRRLLKKGKHLMIFPEGKCNRKKVIRPFKSGCVMLAASAGVQVLPMYIDGEYHAFHGRRCRMIIGEPISMLAPPDGLQADVMERESEELRRTMQALELQLNGFIRVDHVPS